MRNYWYVSLTNRYPQPNADDPIRVVQSVQIKKKYSIIEMTREATPKEIDKYNLRYCGRGYFSEQNIQENINKNLRDTNAIWINEVSDFKDTEWSLSYVERYW